MENPLAGGGGEGGVACGFEVVEKVGEGVAGQACTCVVVHDA